MFNFFKRKTQITAEMVRVHKDAAYWRDRALSLTSQLDKMDRQYRACRTALELEEERSENLCRQLAQKNSAAEGRRQAAYKRTRNKLGQFVSEEL